MTVGWRSPVGGPRYGATIDERHDDVEQWDEERIQNELEEIEFGRATVAPDEPVRADGGNVQLREGETREDDNIHRIRNERQRDIVDEYLDDGDGQLPDVHVGDHVRDRERDDGGTTMLVVGTPVEDASEYDPEDGTVADANPDCPADDDVLKVVFPSRTDVSTRPLTRYAYPRSRVELVAPIHDRGDDDD